MDGRPFYAIGDFIASLLIGMVAAAVCWLVVSPGWNMWAAMAVTMVLGMAVGMVLYIPVGAVLGAMEAMLPAMYTGMWAGMIVGMMGAMMPLPFSHAVQMGAACGVAEILFVWLANTILRGPRAGGGA